MGGIEPAGRGKSQSDSGISRPVKRLMRIRGVTTAITADGGQPSKMGMPP
jgi:hypothetical protein